MKNFNLLTTKLKLEKFFIYELWQHFLIFAVIVLCGWLFNKPIESIFFCIAHWTIRGSCDRQFHCNKISTCLALTSAIICLSIMTMLPVSISLLASIPVAIFVTYVGYLATPANPNIYAMTEDELYSHCRSRGLSDAECKIAYYIVFERLKGKELYDAIGYSERQTIRKRKEILSKIK